MEYKKLDTIINAIDKSLDAQIKLMSLQLKELNKQIFTIERLLQEIQKSSTNKNK